MFTIATWGKDASEVTIRVQVPDKNDTVYPTGGQEDLGNWNPAVMKMEKMTGFMWKIWLELKLLA